MAVPVGRSYVTGAVLLGPSIPPLPIGILGLFKWKGLKDRSPEWHESEISKKNSCSTTRGYSSPMGRFTDDWDRTCGAFRFGVCCSRKQLIAVENHPFQWANQLEINGYSWPCSTTTWWWTTHESQVGEPTLVISMGLFSRGSLSTNKKLGWHSPRTTIRGMNHPSISQMLHVWYIYLHLGDRYGVNVGKYSIHGASGYVRLSEGRSGWIISTREAERKAEQQLNASTIKLQAAIWGNWWLFIGSNRGFLGISGP